MSAADERLDLAGQVAVVTGGSSGIGLAVAVELGRRGVRVVIAGRDAERVEKAAASVPEGLGVAGCQRVAGRGRVSMSPMGPAVRGATPGRVRRRGSEVDGWVR